MKQLLSLAQSLCVYFLFFFLSLSVSHYFIAFFLLLLLCPLALQYILNMRLLQIVEPALLECALFLFSLTLFVHVDADMCYVHRSCAEYNKNMSFNFFWQSRILTTEKNKRDTTTINIIDVFLALCVAWFSV